MDLPIGDLTFLTDGSHYVCIWHPRNEDHTSPRAIGLCAISIGIVADAEDFKQWQKEIADRFARTANKLFDNKLGTIDFHSIGGGQTN